MHICKGEQGWDVILLVSLQNAIQLENNVVAYHYAIGRYYSEEKKKTWAEQSKKNT